VNLILGKEEYIGVFLKKESQDILTRRLASCGFKDSTARVAILNPCPSTEDKYVFEPLFGEKVAFRLTELHKEGDNTMIVRIHRSAHVTFIVNLLCVYREKAACHL
jgi:hypothetical protein